MAKKVSTKKADKVAAATKPARKAAKASAPGRAPARQAAPAGRLPAGMFADKPALKKSPYSKAELEEFRQMLLEKRKSIVGDMNGMENEALRTSRQDAGGDLSLMPDHPANIATDNFEQEFTLGLLESERTLLTEINEALERIDAGTFGICLGTGQAIGKARLKARPWAKYCIEYARLIEKGHVRPGEEKTEMPPSEEEQTEEAEEEEPVEEDLPEPEE
ncbi:MAG: TraR/DksA family transcriptional regulator [Phycisphaerae bacterium]